MQRQFFYFCKKVSGPSSLNLFRCSERKSSSTARKNVFLHDFHAEHNARFVDFAGYYMPLQYSDMSITESHKHTRQYTSVFDVSHMLQTKIKGKDRIKYIESLVVSDVEGLNINQGTLSLFTNDNGGIIDDLIVTKTDNEYLYLVSNAGCTDKDLAHMKKQEAEFKRNGADVEVEVISDKTLLAVQGPGTAKVLQELVDCDLSKLSFMTTTVAKICGVNDCRITRCGYTGEDGVELSIPASKSRDIADNLLSSRQDSVKLAGLGARDTLRLEAGLCLYGNDITEETTPVEAGLLWVIGKRRRETGGFPGDSIILRQIKEKPKVKRVGFLSAGPCPRASVQIMNSEGDVIGKITSGCPSPMLKKNISMGYIDSTFAKVGTKVSFVIHKKQVEGIVTKMPFVPTHYYVK